MKNSEYDEMLELLRNATEHDKLTWSIDPSDETIYETSVNGCRIEVSVYYDTSALTNKASVELFNAAGDSFKKKIFSEKSKPERYNQINDLFNVINDRYYKITESENLILDGLRDLTNDGSVL